MQAILLAGGRIEPDDPFYGLISTETKSMTPICGKPMVQWVLDALSGSKVIEKIFVIGLAEKSELFSKKPLVFLHDQGGIFDNIHFGVEKIVKKSANDETIMVVSGDIPALTSEMVDWLGAQIEVDSYDIYYSTVTRQVMETSFPGSNRSYVHFKDIEVCGGDINIINSRVFNQANDLWKRLSESRKSPMKQAALIGFSTLILVLLKAITLDGAAKRICRKLKIRGKALRVPYAEMAMDVDKLHQLEIMKAFLSEKVC